MLRIRRFGVVQTATTFALVSAVFVLIAFLILGLFVLVFGAGFSDAIPGNTVGFMAQGVVGLMVGGVIAAVLYAIIGFIGAAIGCAVYNLVAGWTGGIELQIDQVVRPMAPEWGAQQPASSPPPPPPAQG